MLEETNDIGFTACRVPEGRAVPPGVYFRLALGGISGHRDLARDMGVLVRPEECAPVAAAIVRVFIDEGDRTDRKKARMKYVLDRWGYDRYLEEVEKILGYRLPRVPAADTVPRAPIDRMSPYRRPPAAAGGPVLHRRAAAGRPPHQRADAPAGASCAETTATARSG